MARHGIVSAEAGEDLKRVQASLAAAPAELRRLLDDTARAQLSGAWLEELKRQPATPQQRKFVLANAQALPFSGGLLARTGDRELGRAFEFGTKNPEKVKTYFRRGSSKRRAHMVTRHVSRQMPAFRAGGHLAYPAANKLGARVFNMWAELVALTLHKATEGKL